VNTAQKVDEHLKSCLACREEHLKLKKIISALNYISIQPAPAPTDFYSKPNGKDFTKRNSDSIFLDGPHQKANFYSRSVIPIPHSVIPALTSVIPAKAGIYILFPTGRGSSRRSPNCIFCFYFYL